MRTVSASFDTYDEVSSAVDGLAEMGVACSEITVVSRRRHARARVVEGAGLGAAIGGVKVTTAHGWFAAHATRCPPAE